MHITIEQIKELIDEPYLSRGRKYAASKDVQLLTVQPKKVIAKVSGNSVYKVSLSLEGSLLDGTCTCPAFSDFGPCKHMAAVAFALTSSQEKTYQASSECKRKVDKHDQFEQSLKRKTKGELIEFINELMSRYPEIEYDLFDPACEEDDFF